MNNNMTSWIVVGLGVVVTALGYYLGRTMWGNILLGFGAAHIILGLLDMFRPTVANRQENK